MLASLNPEGVKTSSVDFTGVFPSGTLLLAGGDLRREDLLMDGSTPSISISNDCALPPASEKDGFSRLKFLSATWGIVSRKMFSSLLH